MRPPAATAWSSRSKRYAQTSSGRVHGGTPPHPPERRGEFRTAERDPAVRVRDRRRRRSVEEETGVLVEPAGILGIYSDPGHIVAYTDGEVRQEYEIMLLARPVRGEPLANDEASEVRWVAPEALPGLDIHPTQWRQLNDYLSGGHPHVD
ncbi:NUDIX domain-containing protein [Nonomuraea glycinis]|uniref:NUDIX domain-containing protein n=1 Tax=Nonomuraea glycinis TaxID=2047744 RepID=UPI002E11DA6A|nr:NUDIX domain-containing protein [Nonomuraea glycinis]